MAIDAQLVAGVNPTVSDLSIDWLNEFGPITSVADIPDDQGGRVMLRLTRSGYDFADETEHLITDYDVWLRIDDARAREMILSEATDLADGCFGDDTTLLEWRGRRYLAMPPGGDRSGMPPGIWAGFGGFPAIQQDEYGFIAETLADSTAAGTAWAVYCVTAHTASPIDWYASHPDSGYSVDNLPPGVPTGLAFSEPTILEWDAAPAQDFAYHTVYGSEDPVFDPAATLIGYTVDPIYDVSGSIFGYFHVTTSDHADNESEAASIESQTSSALDGDPLPTRFAFRAPQPNPFRSQASLGFDLPVAESVRLAPGRASSCFVGWDERGRSASGSRGLLRANQRGGLRGVATAGEDSVGRCYHPCAPGGEQGMQMGRQG